MIKTFIFSIFIIISIIFVSGENDEFPQKVSVLKNESIHCGGVMLSSRHVLTLESCISGKESTRGTSKDFERNVTQYYGTFSPSKIMTVGYKSKSYEIATIDLHSLQRTLESTPIFDGGLAILTLENKIKINKINHSKQKSELSKSTIIGNVNVINEEFVKFNEFLEIKENDLFQIRRDGFCEKLVDATNNDRVCGVSTGKLTDSCNIYPGDPVYNANLEIIGLMERHYNCKNDIPFIFVNINPHKSWITSISPL